VIAVRTKNNGNLLQQINYKPADEWKINFSPITSASLCWGRTSLSYDGDVV